MDLTRKQAQDLFEEVVAKRNASKLPFEGDMEKTFRAHCAAVARIAETIAANCSDLDTDKAYIFGLLHDAGRIEDEPRGNTFHGIIGYHYLMEKNLPEIAKISVTHCFYNKDFDINTYPQNKEQLLEAKRYLANIEYDDYDRLIQLADVMNDMGKTCSIEYRMDSVGKRYRILPEKIALMVKRLYELKAYFDAKCGKDIYAVLGIKEEK